MVVGSTAWVQQVQLTLYLVAGRGQSFSRFLLGFEYFSFSVFLSGLELKLFQVQYLESRLGAIRVRPKQVGYKF